MKLIKKYLKSYSDRKLEEKINILFIVIILAFAVMVFFLYRFIFPSNLREYAIQNSRDTLVSIGSNVQAKVESTNTLSKQIMIDRTIIEYLKAETARDIQLNARVNETIDEFFSITKDINSIYIFRLDKNYVKIRNAAEEFHEEILWDKDIQERIFAGKGSYLLAYNGWKVFGGKEGKNYLTFYRLINDISSQKPIGILAINMNLDILNDCINGFSGGAKGFCFWDQEGIIVMQNNWNEQRRFAPVQEAAYGFVTNGGIFNEEVASYYKIPKSDIIVFSHETIGLTSMVRGDILLMVVVIAGFVLMVLWILRCAVKRYVTRPIEKLVASMGEVKTGRFHRVSLSLPNDEIGQLKNSYNQMLVELNRLVEELINKEKVIQKAELDILQEQIKPHFLYNTIDMIGNLALEAQAKEVYDALETLGDFYRKFLSRGRREVTIAEEVEIVRDYLKLQKLRYGDIFEDIYEIDEELKELKVPKLILQPLVENSLYHGIRMKGEKGVIRIRVTQNKSSYFISVYDTGVGMSEEMIQKIYEAYEFRNFGVKGTMERIRYYYDSKCEIHISSQESQYTEVTIIIYKERGLQCTA